MKKPPQPTPHVSGLVKEKRSAPQYALTTHMHGPKKWEVEWSKHNNNFPATDFNSIITKSIFARFSIITPFRKSMAILDLMAFI
jgi:hypothetical protein